MIYHIAAITENNAIGFENDLVTRSKEDLQNFKKLTTGQVVVMGRKTFESMGSKPLPNRTNVVITSDPKWVIGDSPESNKNIIWYLIPDECKDNLANYLMDSLNEFEDDGKDVYIIGGGEIYKQTIDWIDELIISHFPITVEEADTFYPEIDKSTWEIISTESMDNDKFTLSRYRRIEGNYKD